MSKPLMTQTEEEKLRGLLSLLKGAEQQPSSRETVQLPMSSLRQVVGLVELLLTQKPIVLEKDLSPNEAAELAGISRTMVMKFLKSGRLKGYEVGSHWRVSKDSLLKYLEEREDMMKMMEEMDKAGFGLD